MTKRIITKKTIFVSISLAIFVLMPNPLIANQNLSANNRLEMIVHVISAKMLDPTSTLLSNVNTGNV